MYSIRKTESGDVSAVMHLIELARTTMSILGIDQWQNGYPAESDIQNDIENGESYVLIDEEEIIGSFVITELPDPSYGEIEGEWKIDGVPYISIHRLTVAPDHRRTYSNPKQRHSATKFIMDYIKQYAEMRHIEGGIRSDTHEGNIPMRRMLEYNGFTYCGVIHLNVDNEERGKARVAYQFAE